MSANNSATNLKPLFIRLPQLRGFSVWFRFSVSRVNLCIDELKACINSDYSTLSRFFFFFGPPRCTFHEVLSLQHKGILINTRSRQQHAIYQRDSCRPLAAICSGSADLNKLQPNGE